MESDAYETTAAADLAALQQGRSALADRARQPWWYDPTLGVLVFLVFGSLSLRSIPWLVAAVVVFTVGLLLLKRGYERHTGFWVSGLRPGATQRATRVWFGVYAVVVGAAGLLEGVFGVRGAFAVAGALLGIAIALLSRWWTTIYQRELRTGA